MGQHPVTLVGLLRSRDTNLMMGALRSLGVEFHVDPDDETTVRVVPPSSGRFAGDVDVYCGLAGTVMRFVPGLAMFADGPVRFDGDAQAYARPMKPVLDGLEQLGAHIEYHREPGRLPFTLTPARGMRRDGRAGAYGVHRCVGSVQSGSLSGSADGSRCRTLRALRPSRQMHGSPSLSAAENVVSGGPREDGRCGDHVVGASGQRVPSAGE